MRSFLHPAALAVLAAFVGLAPAWAYERPVGSAERRALLDAVRPQVEDATDGAVEFVVRELTVAGDFAFLIGEPQRPGGAGIRCEDTPVADQCVFRDGFTTYALLQEGGDRWNVIDSAVGPTDVAWEWWAIDYGAPCAIMPAGTAGC